jgi:hypothetical protein
MVPAAKRGYSPSGTMDETSPTNPFHIARAYGAPRPVSVRPVAPPIVQRGSANDGVAASIRPTRSAGISKLVGGVVPGGIDFVADAPQPSRPAMPFYRHPADQNAAATAIANGKHLDIKG